MDCYAPAILCRIGAYVGSGVHAMNNKLREEFNRWWAREEQEELRKSCAKGWAEYIWRSSREALKVELPNPEYFGDYWSGDWAYNVEDTRDALLQSGIEVI
ncbi:hypothetical protein GY15_16745 [Delftia sp. 670]|uniref:Uncharacterized protein n=1 Tax=Pseudomonas phage PaP1 TaxID=685892 RepID=G0YVB7_9CAUD|nr:hypothetical protein PaP1_gp114 [Pseudomonas phage PaP1]AEK21654.1 hypothetical protein PaP1_gp114 [Pseudomonas phage PaP1]KEH08677.1 hypothetical protein GY14_17315 [Delftia tsuruhatensis]KEH13007.1 hypothetical protein GY15_16745 [Delftia sp. 670]